MLEGQSEKPFPFDLGSAFANLSRYLSTTDKLALASTCSLLRQVCMRGPVWQSFEISDAFLAAGGGSYLRWAEKYLAVIEPTELVVVLQEEKYENESQLLRVLLQPKESVEAVSIRCRSEQLHLAIASACRNASRLTLHSAEITDGLAEFMLRCMGRVAQLEITADALGFSLAGASRYLRQPLEKLILKPHNLDYEEVVRVVRDEGLNRLDELEIDVEECEEQQLVEIVSALRHISRLRLYHMERFDRHDYAQLLADRLAPDIKELALTKCYHLDLAPIARRVACPTLRALDLTEAARLTDHSVLELALACCNLRQINLSWCNELSDCSVKEVIRRCPALERVVLTGLKALTDAAFEEYVPFAALFREKAYDEAKYAFMKECRRAKEGELAGIHEKCLERTALARLFQSSAELHVRRRTLGNLRELNCHSCNNVSDKMLKVIYCFSRMAQVINYYGDDLSLVRNSFEEEFID